jgi:protein-disulfide isomerase
MRKTQGPVSKRQAIKERRRQQQRRQRLLMILIISGLALLVAGILIAPTIGEALTPVGEITQITPTPRPLADGAAMGDPEAPVRIEVYSDFQCSACLIFAKDIEPQIAETYVPTGQVYLVYRQFPFLDDRVPGNESKQAANASMCAAEQDRFWDYHDILFANLRGTNQGSFTDKRLIAFAEALNLNMDTFEECFRANRYATEINTDLAEGRAANVQGTPSVFVNGQQLTPGRVPSFGDIQQAVEAALTTSGDS